MQRLLENSIKSVLVFGLVLTNVGCASIFSREKVKPVEIVSKPVERLPLNIQHPTLGTLDTPTWYILTPDNAEEIWKEIAEKGENTVIFGMTDNGYRDLANTMARLRNHIQTQKTIIDKYKDYYEPEKENK